MDVHCLGVKNTLGPLTVSRIRIDQALAGLKGKLFVRVNLAAGGAGLPAVSLLACARRVT